MKSALASLIIRAILGASIVVGAVFFSTRGSGCPDRR